MTLPIGSKLGSYEIVSSLGAGGMGEVYRARDDRLGRDVALKVLPAEVASDVGRLRRFEKEARSASLLNHPHIVTVYEIGESAGRAFIAMELVEGRTMREILADGPLPTRKALAIATQLADGLAKAHGAGIVHRDLKPENVMVTRDGFAKILDFGLAKLTQPEADSGAGTEMRTVSEGTEPGMVVGTVSYMSPEQTLGRPLDYRSDQFALGSMVYEMLVGKKAFGRPTGPETMTAIIREEPEPLAAVAPSVPAPLRWIVERCLAKDPEDRYASTRDLARDFASLRDHLSDLSVSSAAVSARRPRALWSRASAAAVLLALVAAAGVLAGRRLARVPSPTFTPVTYRRGSILSARFAPDGESVVYSAAWDGNAPRLFLKRRDSPDEVPIALPSADILSISRSGEMAIALDCRWTHNGVCSGALARAPMTAGAARPVADNVQQADWSPDGDGLVVARDLGGRGRIEFPVGKVLYETAGHTSYPRLSPKGDRVAFLDHPFKVDDRGSVAVMDLAGHKRTLTREWEGIEGLAWSPGGDEIWFTAADISASFALHAVSESGRERLLARFPSGMRLHDISRAGRVLFTQESSRVQIAGRISGEERERDLGWLDWSLARDISRDGKTLLFEESNAAVGSDYAVCLRGMDGSPVVRLGQGSALALSPDGKWALTGLITGDAPLVLLATGAGERRVLPTAGIHPEEAEWLDARRIVLAGAAVGRPMRLYVQDIDGGAPRPMSPEGIEASYIDRIAPSPDARFVAAVGPDHRIALYPVDGGTPRSLPAATEGEFPQRWSGDGRWLYIRGSRALEPPGRIFRIDVATGRREPWRELMPADPTGVRVIGASALGVDGQTYAYSYGLTFSQLFVAEGIR